MKQLILALSLCQAGTAFAGMDAVSALWSAERSFQPLSGTSESVTGAITITPAEDGLTLRFGNGATTTLTLVADTQTPFNDTDAKVPGKIFALDNDPGKLINDNTLCGADQPARHVVLSEIPGTDDDSVLTAAVFSSEKPPVDMTDPGLCGTYSYMVE